VLLAELRLLASELQRSAVMSKHIYLFALGLVVGCGGSDGTSTTDSELTGSSTYRDSATAKDGTAHQAASPPAQSAKVSLVVKGTGTIPNVDPQCATDPAGVFEAHYLGTATVGEDGAYLAAIEKAGAKIQTPSGCEIPELTVGVITDIVVRSELTVNTQNCQSFCDAHARWDAESVCGAEPDAAQCRTETEAEVTAACQSMCEPQAEVIVAETSLGAGALGTLDAGKLRAVAFGTIDADLEYDHVE
jgi:hypothetical protein